MEELENRISSREVADMMDLKQHSDLLRKIDKINEDFTQSKIAFSKYWVKEIWKDIEGYEGLYQVSNLGRVKSLPKPINVPGRGVYYSKEKIIKLSKNRGGYLEAHLCKEGKMKVMRVHRLVANAFISNPKNKEQVDHINTIRDDNRVENLRWATRSENINNPLTKEKQKKSLKGNNLGCKNHFYGKKGKDCINSKRIFCLDINTEKVLYTFECAREVGEFLGISYSHIGDCCNGKRNHTGGYKWKFA